MAPILLKGGVVLVHGDNDKVTPTHVDILVEDDRIGKIEAQIEAQEDYEIIDCEGKLISPGFIDTHHHLWQSSMKGLFSNSTFIEYLEIMFAASKNFTPDDVFWNNLAGAMECLDAGTTTILDHSHLNWTKDHSKQALAGTITSGVRSIFAYTYTLRLEEVEPKVKFSPEPLASWVMETFQTLASSPHLKNPHSRIQLGLGFDWWFLPKDVVLEIFSKVKSLGAKIITCHSMRVKSPEGQMSLPDLLQKYGLLNKGMVLSHCSGAAPEEGKLLSEANVFVSSTPSTEQQMAVGPPVCFREDLPEMQKVCSLGIDCHSSTSASLINEMRIGLQTARGHQSAASLKAGKFPEEVTHKVEQAYNMGTIQGARALCMEEDIGSIAVGKKADLVIFDALSPAMIGAAQQDPVGAIVLHSTIGDIDTVIVDGVIRKRDGKLLSVQKVEWREEGDFVETEETLGWRKIAQKILEIQKQFVTTIAGYDLKKIGEAVQAMFGFK